MTCGCGVIGCKKIRRAFSHYIGGKTGHTIEKWTVLSNLSEDIPEIVLPSTSH
jgi:hypothetical protein